MQTQCRLSSICEITPSLYLSNGTAACNEAKVEEKKIDYIINVTSNIPAQKFKHIKVMKIRINDKESEEISAYFDEVSGIVESNSMSGKRTLIHCQAGISRSASLCIAYLIKYHRMTLKEAFNHVKRCRPIIFPNRGFWKQLIAFEYSLKGRNSVKMIQTRDFGEIPDFYFRK